MRLFAVAVSVMVFTLTGRTQPAESARILAIETVAGRSNWNFMSAVLGALTNGGHSVTAFTPFPSGDRDNYTEVDMSDRFPARAAMSVEHVASLFNDQRKTLSFVTAMGRRNCRSIRETGRMSAYLADGLRAHFDAILIEPLVPDCLTHMATQSRLPVIFAVPTATHFLKQRAATGHVSNPAVVSPVTAYHAVPRTFAQRLANAVSTLHGTVIVTLLELWYKVTDPEPYELLAPVPPSLVFVNGHFVSDASSPNPPNVVGIGGIHLKPPKKIPADILEFIEDSSHGVILFTFGSTLAMCSIPENIQQAIKEALTEIPQRVLMKYEGEMKDKPENIMTRKWLPQRDILKHPKVKLFISHGGISGIYEAVDAGVPVLGLPVIFDQNRNIDNLMKSGMALSMNLFFLTKETFLKNILELVNNKKYVENAKIASGIFNDRPMSSEKSVTYWTEYVIRHKGAPHLKSHGLSLTWYQYFLLDVIVVALVLISLTIVLIYKVFVIFYNIM